MSRTNLVRERLLDRLAARWSVPIVVVSAPPGYGKTTLLRQATTANREAAAGTDLAVTCTPRSTALSSLATLLYGAVGAPASSSSAGIDEIVATVIEALWRHAPRHVALLIDDVHEVPAGSDAAELLRLIALSLPSNGHLVLCGRSSPPFPRTRLEVEDRMVHIGVEDMAFTPAESVQFAALRGVPEDVVMSCGGWPGLAELAARPGGSTAHEYVGEEVLGGLGPTERREIALLSHICPFDEDLASAVLGRRVDLVALLGHLPLVERGPGSEWSLHALWPTFLADEVSPAEIADAQRRAGEECMARGEPGAAVPLLIDAAAWDQVAVAIIGALGAASPPVARDVLEEWSSKLPAASRAEPSGRLLTAVASAEDLPDVACRGMEAAAAELRSRGDVMGELTCLVQLGLHAWRSNDSGHLALVASRVLEMETAGCEAAIPFACLGRALLFDMADDSTSMLAELRRIPHEALNEQWLAIIGWLRSIALLQLGHAAEAERTADEAIAGSRADLAALIESTRLQAVWFQGRAAEVFDVLPRVVKNVARSGSRLQLALAAAQASVAYALHGEVDQAAASLDSARGLAVAVDNAPLVDTVMAVAEAVAAVTSHDEAAGRAHLTTYLSHHPLGDGIPVAVQRRYIPLFYVLVPESRPVWDEMDLGPTWRIGRDLARAVVRSREDGTLLERPSVLENTDLVRAHLPPTWIAELALAAVGSGHDHGWQLLEATWPESRPAVTSVAAVGRAPLRKAAQAVMARLPAPPPGEFELRLLGPMELRFEGNLVDAPYWRRDRVRALLTYLVLRRTVSRSQVAEDLWPELRPDSQSRNLRVTLTYLLQLLEPGRPSRAPSFFVRPHGNNLVLRPERWLKVDLWDFDELSKRAAAAERQGAPGEVLDSSMRALALWRGEPNEILSLPWALSEFEQRRVRFATMAIRAGELHLARRHIDQARDIAQQALAADPWLGDAYQLLIAAQQASGDELAFHRAVERYRASLEELGLDAGEAAAIVGNKLESSGFDLPQRSDAD